MKTSPLNKILINKDQLKESLPKPVADTLRFGLRRYRRSTVFRLDRKRFNRYALDEPARGNQEQLESKITFHAHSIEKGLSHEQLRLGFGKGVLTKLADVMRLYARKGFDTSGTGYCNALEVLRAYIDVHQAADFDLTYLHDILGDLWDEVADTEAISGGVRPVTAASKANNKTKNFHDLFTGRWSVREYADSPVDQGVVKKAVELSLKAPSVCNRQSGRVYEYFDAAQINQILKQQGGFGGYQTPPGLLMVTTDTRSFLDPTERNQVYTDGGLFSMALLLALEYYGIAACPLNAMLSVRQEKEIRRITKLPEYQNIVMFIAIGNFKETINVPKSFRFDIDHYLKN